MAELKTICTRYSSRDTGFLARLIWQELFKFYVKHEGTLDHLNSFLCDLEIFELFIKRLEMKFFWYTDFKSGYTETLLYKDESYPNMVTIEIHNDSIDFRFPTI